MAYQIEGTPVHGFRVIDDEVGPLTARLRTKDDALKAADITEAKSPKKAAARPSK